MGRVVHRYPGARSWNVEGRQRLEAAVRAGSYYERFVLDELIFGSPEDVQDAPTSEDGYNAVMAYTSLFEATGSPKWLELASQAADWTLSFRWAHNLAPYTAEEPQRFVSYYESMSSSTAVILASTEATQ